MAGVGFVIAKRGIPTIVGLKTLLQCLAAADHRVLIKEWEVTFEGVDPVGTPITVQLVRQTSTGTMTAETPRKLNSSDGETLQVTGSQGASSEPTDAGEVIENRYIHPQSGFRYQAPFDSPIVVPGGERLGIRVVAAAVLNASAMFRGEE